MKCFFLFSVISLLFWGCSKQELYKGAPSCIASIIKKADDNNTVSVYRYSYKGKEVYLVNKGCCDWYNELYDSDCHLICAPSGGFSGNGDGRCTDFHTSAAEEELIWKK